MVRSGLYGWGITFHGHTPIPMTFAAGIILYEKAVILNQQKDGFLYLITIFAISFYDITALRTKTKQVSFHTY